MRQKKIKFDPPEEIREEVRNIIDISQVFGRFNLVPYKEESLNEALRILRKYGRRPSLQEAIKDEIDERIRCRESPAEKPQKLINWFEPRWEAVRALYGKGTASLNDWETQEYLNSIDESWIKNCKGSM